MNKLMTHKLHDLRSTSDGNCKVELKVIGICTRVCLEAKDSPRSTAGFNRHRANRGFLPGRKLVQYVTAFYH
jgi:hypothetical protein